MFETKSISKAFMENVFAIHKFKLFQDLYSFSITLFYLIPYNMVNSRMLLWKYILLISSFRWCLSSLSKCPHHVTPSVAVGRGLQFDKSSFGDPSPGKSNLSHFCSS